MRKYNTEDLYVGVLASVNIVFTTGGYKKLSLVNNISGNKPFIIFKKIIEETRHSYYYDQNILFWGADIFTNKKYLLFASNGVTAHEKLSVESFVITKSIPIEQFMDAPKLIISKNKLLKIYEKMNAISSAADVSSKGAADVSSKGADDVSSKSAADVSSKSAADVSSKSADDINIKDGFLRLILKTNEKLSSSNLDINEKDKFSQKLVSLAKEYIDRISNLRANTIVLTFDTEDSILMEFVNKLVEIDLEIDNESSRHVSNLQNQLESLKKILGSYDN